MFTGHNCTNYVAYRLVQSGHAGRPAMGGQRQRLELGRGDGQHHRPVPTVGSVAWYKPHVTPAGANGHVAYVEQVISDTEIIVSEDYWGGDFYWRRITKAGGGWPSGFIHFNDRVVEPTPPPTIAGSPMVGSPLEVAAGAWTPAPTSVTSAGSPTVPKSPGPPAPTTCPRPTSRARP